MQTRKDLLQAHRLMTRRAGLALVQGEADTGEQPLRRINVGTFAGVMLAAVAVVGFWLVGVLTHSGAKLNGGAANTVIMDKDTGTPFVFCGHATLCQAANFASALLFLDSQKVSVHAVSQGSLAGFARGQEVGIPGLPPVPLSKDLVRGPWSVCVHGGSAASAQQPSVTVVAGRSVGGQRVGDAQALLVSAQGQTWVVWHGERLALSRRYQAAAIQGGIQDPVPVPATWLDALPRGPDFAPPAIPGAGQPTSRGPNGNATVGQVYEVQAVNGTQWYVQLSDGLSPISKTQAALLQNAQTGSGTIQESPGAASQNPSAQVLYGGGLPATPPSLASYDPATPLCATYAGGTGQVSVNGSVPSGSLPTLSQGAADDVWLPPGTGALVGVTTAKGQPPSTYFLVTGANRYALASPAIATVLGYQLATQGAVVPVNIIDLIPNGPALDPSKAHLTVVGG